MAAPSTTKPAPAGAGSRLQEVDRPGQGIDSVNTKNRPARQHWRDRLPVHPAAELFPLMSKNELRELADDIDKNGLRVPVTLCGDTRLPDGSGVKVGGVVYLLDGRNRLDALELLGRKLFGANGAVLPSIGVMSKLNPKKPKHDYVGSLNIHRRHLNAEQKRDLVAKLLTLDPEKSDRQIAATVKGDNKTVAKQRREMESREEIPHAAKRTDTKGRKQPAARTIKVKVTHATKQIVAPFTVVERGGPPKRVNLTILPENSKNQRQQEDSTAFDHQSRRALAEFKYACKAYLPKMNAAHRQEAVDHVASIVGKIDKAAP
jgi:hypothetical protein